ncbi:MAG: hypothetical protein EOO29_27880 [Comamonadaceae bacterium]|nr:MAG: hypothetical protein EOO29_27880 [Comamonadaceae bacterium]
MSTLRVPVTGGGAAEAGAALFAATPALPAASADAGGAAAAGASASPTLAEVERTTQLEAALAELRAEARQSRQTQVELRGELAEARENRYSNPLVYVLGLLLVLLAATLWALWRAGRRVPESPWVDAAPRQGPIRRHLTQRRARATANAQALAQARADDEDTSHGPMYFPTAVSRRGQLSASDDDQDLPGEAAAAPHGADGAEDAEASSARSALPRALDVDELYDVQQQAEFFTSLGQHEQAIEALRHYVNEHPQASALAYLELLNLYHQTQREADYEQLRQKCQQGLNVHLPGFHEFGAVGGRTLEHYPQARARLESHWPRAETLEVIEDMLFRRGDADAAEAFDLAAYRELLMLYALVQEQQFAEDQTGPSLDDLLRLPRMDGAAKLTSNAPSPQARMAQRDASLASVGGAGNDPFDRVLDPQRGDFQPTWPPSLDSELDMDLARLEAQQIDTIPLALRRAPAAPVAPDMTPPTLSLEMPSAVLGELTLAPLDEPAAPGVDPSPEASAAGSEDSTAVPGADAPRSTRPLRTPGRR